MPSAGEQAKWHDDEHKRFCRVGAHLRDTVTPGEWHRLTAEQRAAAVERVVEDLRAELKIKHDTPIEWSTDPDDEGLGYDETRGMLVVPRRHLDVSDPVALIAGLAQELRHAWQMDVIEKRSPHPLGETGRRALEETLRAYTAEDIIRYTANELELDAEMVEVAVRQGYAWPDVAAEALTVSQAQAVEPALPSAPRAPGLYAIHAPPKVWKELALGEPPDARPLYVGKSESSLLGRDAGTHFGYTDSTRSTSVTGYSTVRRSLAALLHDTSGFRGVPRNPTKPGNYANYGLSRRHDDELSQWMRQRLQLAWWPKPDDCTIEQLALVEQAVFRRLLPPLNLKDVVTPWKPRIDAARRVMATEARRWAGDR